METITISIDAMGGDNAPNSEVAGAVDTIRDHDAINIVSAERI
jgi:fatty acid/phospholipid biosynthesis enzyme